MPTTDRARCVAVGTLRFAHPTDYIYQSSICLPDRLIPNADQEHRRLYFFVWLEPVGAVVPALELFFPLFVSVLVAGAA